MKCVTLNNLSPDEPSLGGLDTCKCRESLDPSASKHRTYEASVSKLLSAKELNFMKNIILFPIVAFQE